MKLVKVLLSIALVAVVLTVITGVKGVSDETVDNDRYEVLSLYEDEEELAHPLDAYEALKDKDGGIVRIVLYGRSVAEAMVLQAERHWFDHSEVEQAMFAMDPLAYYGRESDLVNIAPYDPGCDAIYAEKGWPYRQKVLAVDQTFTIGTNDDGEKVIIDRNCGKLSGEESAPLAEFCKIRDRMLQVLSPGDSFVVRFYFDKDEDDLESAFVVLKDF